TIDPSQLLGQRGALSVGNNATNAMLEVGGVCTEFQALLAGTVNSVGRLGGTQEAQIFFRSAALAGTLAHVSCSAAMLKVAIVSAPASTRKWLHERQRALSDAISKRLGRPVQVQVAALALDALESDSNV